MSKEFKMNTPENGDAQIDDVTQSSISSQDDQKDESSIPVSRALSMSVPKIPMFSGEKDKWKDWLLSCHISLDLLGLLYTIEDLPVDNVNLKSFGQLSSATVWQDAYLKTLSAKEKALFDQDCRRTFSLLYTSLSTAAKSKVNVLPRGSPAELVLDSSTVLIGDAKKLWAILHSVYEKQSTTTFMMDWERLRVQTLKPGEKVADYLSRLKELRYQLNAQGDCMSERQLTCYFLKGLPSRFASTVAALSVNDKLTLDEAVAGVTLSEERMELDRLLKTLSLKSDSTQETVNYVKGRFGGRGGKFKSRPRQVNGRQGGFMRQDRDKGNSYRNNSYQEQRPRDYGNYERNKHQTQGNSGSGPVCFVCNGRGHIARNCKFNKNKPTQVRSKVPRYGRAMYADDGEDWDDDEDSRAYLTRVVNRDDCEQSYATRRMDENGDGEVVLILDSGSNGHHVGDEGKVRLTEVARLAKPSTVLTASDEPLVSKVKGNVGGYDQHGNEMLVKDVKYTPGFKVNLISVSQWCQQGDEGIERTMVFGKDGMTAYEDGKMVFQGVQRGGLYEVRLTKESQRDRCYVGRNDTKEVEKYMKLHERLGHLGKTTISKILKKDAVDGIREDELPSLSVIQQIDEPCESCVMGKGHRSPFSKKSSRIKARDVMDRLHADLSGPINGVSTVDDSGKFKLRKVAMNDKVREVLGNKLYVSVIVDEKSGFVSVKPISKKSDAGEHLMEFVMLGENITGKKVRFIHTDQGSEYVNQYVKQFAARKGIVLETAVAHTPEQNGLVERMNQTLGGSVRVSLFRARLDYAFWPLAYEYSAYIEGYRIKGDRDVTVAEEFLDSRPSVKRLRVFGCDCFVIITPPHRTKLEPRARKCIFVGYSPNNDGAYKCYDVQKHEIIITRDVVFKDTFEHGIEEGLRRKTDHQTIEEITTTTNNNKIKRERKSRNFLEEDEKEKLPIQKEDVEKLGDEQLKLLYHLTPDDPVIRRLVREEIMKNNEEKTRQTTREKKQESEIEYDDDIYEVLELPVRNNRRNQQQQQANANNEEEKKNNQQNTILRNQREMMMIDDDDDNDSEIQLNLPAAPRPSSVPIRVPAAEERKINEIQIQQPSVAKRERKEIIQQHVRQARQERKNLPVEIRKLQSHTAPPMREIRAQVNENNDEKKSDLPSTSTTRSGRRTAPPTYYGMTNVNDIDPREKKYATDTRTMRVPLNNKGKTNERVNLAYTNDVPQTYLQAMQREERKEWKRACDEEMKNMNDNDVYELVDRKEATRSGKNVLKSRWVFAVKTNKDGAIERYKARFVACGYSQEAGVDFDETFAPVGRYKTLRIVLCLVAEMDFELKQMDVVSAFLNAKLREELFIEQPDGYANGATKDKMVWKLKKAIYGIKQAPYEWNKEINGLLVGIGFTRMKTDTCLYTKISKSGKVIVLFVFVDDIVIAYHRTDKDEWMYYRSILMNRYKVKDLGDLQWVLGMRVTRDRAKKTITLDQGLYIKKMITKFNLDNAKPVKVPGDRNLRLVQPQDNQQDKPQEHHEQSPSYREIVGSLLYASIGTRPDIAHAVHEISKFNNNPSPIHYKAALRVVKYLSGTHSSHVLTYKASGQSLSKFVVNGRVVFAPQLHVSVFCDADWAGDLNDRKSTSGYLVRINNSTVSWSAKKQNTTSLSSAEAEYMAIASAAQEAIWTRQFITEMFHLTLDINNLYSCTILTDNTSALQIAKHDVSHDRTKHIDIRYHFIRDYLQEGWFDLQWVSTDVQLADIFTKVLPINRFESLVDSILHPSHTQVV